MSSRNEASLLEGKVVVIEFMSTPCSIYGLGAAPYGLGAATYGLGAAPYGLGAAPYGLGAAPYGHGGAPYGRKCEVLLVPQGNHIVIQYCL